ncbi:hypothetical protein LIER_27245 [Lithospermum erythrorhizon]|uniref:Pectinesterase inhibitor domain-containing protein n=1 Tax=Lithospermum erythrorhizon TaxID=34254 RepID=A0AAV3RCZ5_LITER
MMNFLKKNALIGVMLLGIFALSFALHVEAQIKSETPNAIDPFCTGGDAEPNMQAVCTKLAGGGKTWEEAATFSINRIMRKANTSVTPLLATIEAKLSPSMEAFKKSQIVDVCKNSYQEAIENLQKCRTLIKDGPFSDYGSTLTSISTCVEDCLNAIFEENGQHIEEAFKFTKRIQKLVDVALIISKKDPRLENYNVRLAKGEFKDSPGDPSLIGPINQNFYGANP